MRRATDGNRTSRWSASFVIAVAVHAAVFALLAGSAIVQLELVPTTIDLAFLDLSDRTAGPGETSPEMRAAAAPAAEVPSVAVLSPPPPPEPAPAELDPVDEPAPVVAPPAPKREPAPKPPQQKPREKVVASKSPARTAKNTAPAPTFSAPSGAASTEPSDQPGTGDDSASRSGAPVWAPTASLRYEQVLLAWMNRHKQYPMLAQRRQIEGNGKVRVRIARDGRVIELSVVDSTGEKILDQAALDMVRRASPFPAVPAEYPGETYQFNAPINYQLR